MRVLQPRPKNMFLHIISPLATCNIAISKAQLDEDKITTIATILSTADLLTTADAC